jgi:hypothetical protein
VFWYTFSLPVSTALSAPPSLISFTL